MHYAWEAASFNSADDLTLNFFFLSGVMKPFFCLVPALINSVRTLSLRLDLSLKMEDSPIVRSFEFDNVSSAMSCEL